MTTLADFGLTPAAVARYVVSIEPPLPRRGYYRGLAILTPEQCRERNRINALKKIHTLRAKRKAAGLTAKGTPFKRPALITDH